MKIGKKAMSLSAMLLGAVVFTTAAAADVAMGSGYGGLKNAAKTTMVKLCSEVDSFTGNAGFSVQIDGQTYMSEEVVAKADNQMKALETLQTSVDPIGENGTFYSYTDSERRIYKSDGDDQYYVSNRGAFETEDDGADTLIENPFEEEEVQDLEKVLDAFVGTMKDTVQVENNEDGRLYIVSMSDAEVPALVNAVMSFAVKYGMLDSARREETKFPLIKNDLYVRTASGKAFENNEGLLESVMAAVSLAGQDENGGEHEIVIELSMDISDIGTTTVVPPVLTAENSVESNEGRFIFDEAYVGTYKNDIVRREGDSFVKIGERVFEITECGDGTFSGRYHEDYRPGYEPETARAFDVIGVSDGDWHGDAQLTYMDGGEEKSGLIYTEGGRGNPNLRLMLDVTFMENGGYSCDYPDDFDAAFVRVLE